MKKTMMLVVALVLAGPQPALAANHRGDRYTYDDGGDCDQDGNCGRQSYDGQWSNEDRNRNRNRNRGSFSPGPFDRSPVEITGNTVCMPGATCYANPPKENPK